MNPLISVIIPTYNRAHLLEETLDCILKQSYQNWECIIIDDFSEDLTFRLLEEYNKKDKRFVFYIKSENDKKGASSSRNIGLCKAKGDFIQFLDSDDIFAKNKLEIQLNAIVNENDNAVATCKWGIFKNHKEDGKIYEKNLFYKNFQTSLEYFNLVGEFGGFFPLHCFLIPKKIIEKAGCWSEELSLNDDGEFIFRVLINTSKIYFCPETNVLYRQNDSESLSSKKSVEDIESLILSWQKIEINYFKTYGYGKSFFLKHKKEKVYRSIKYSHQKLIAKNKEFFKEQIELDTDRYNIKLNYRKIRNIIKFYIRKYLDT